MSLPWWRKVAALVNRNARMVGSPGARGSGGRFFNLLWLEHLEDRTLPSTYQWVGGSSVNWNDPNNWSGGSAAFPNAQGDVAQFTGSYSTAQTVLVNQAIT